MSTQIAPENVIGRDSLIKRIWEKLAKKSLRLTAERRIGKTTVMTKMAAEPKEGFEVLFLELEGIDSPDRFTEKLLNRMKPLLSTKDQAKGWLDVFLENIGGTEIGGVIKLPDKSKMGWQVTLEKAFEGLCLHQKESKILLLFDELPYMLQKIATNEVYAKENVALTLLDSLRSMRQEHKNLRMIYAGSVGLHHVLTDLRQEKLASEPVNDMPMVEIHALQYGHAQQLAEQLLKDEDVTFNEDIAAQALERLVKCTDQIPFYLEMVIEQLGEIDREINLEDIDETVEKQLSSDHDPWEMEHFRGRLLTYYRGVAIDIDGKEIPNATIARSILDHFSVTDEPQSIDQVCSYVASQFSLPDADNQRIVQMLKSLGQDHYLICDTQKNYSFRFALIKGWWRTAQGLVK